MQLVRLQSKHNKPQSMQSPLHSLVVVLSLLLRIQAYVGQVPHARQRGHRHGRTSSSAQQLVPLTSVSEELSFLSDSSTNRYQIKQNEGEDLGFYLPEEDDLDDLTAFVVQSFGADAINLSQDFNAVEQFLLQPVAGFLNGYSALAAYAEVLTGLRQRLHTRLSHLSIDAPSMSGLESKEQIREASRSSLVFVVAQTKKDSGYDILASVELRLELTDGKIPFSLPWLDRAERRFASWFGWFDNKHSSSIDLQPYLSSLCVDEAFRKRGLGRALVHCCEDVARICWGRDRMYLHVDPDNTAAVQLYESEDYQQVYGVRWNPFWAGPAAEIRYYVKDLSLPPQ